MANFSSPTNCASLERYLKANWAIYKNLQIAQNWLIKKFFGLINLNRNQKG